MNEFAKFALIGVLVVIAIYIVVRISTAAYFRSKQDYEKRK